MKKWQKISALAAFLFCIFALIGWKFFSKKDKYDEVHLKIYGYVKMADGIGRQAVELIQALKEDVSVAFVPTRVTDPTDIPSDVLKIVMRDQRRCKSKVAILEDVIRMPGHSPWKMMIKRSTPDQIKIAYTMTESTKIPAEWVYALNGYFDAVVVPDSFLVEVYKNSGVEIPIFELPLGLYLDPFFKEPLKEKASNPMVFGYLSSCIERKNHLQLVRGFAKAFGNRDDVSLRMNYRYGEEAFITAVKEEISKLGLENIHFTNFELENAPYLRYFKSLDCYISVSKGEGFSIQPREAMALGIPVIVTDNTAQSTICKSGFVKSIPSLIEEPALYWWGLVHGKRFDCKVDDIAAALLDVYENYNDYLKKANQSREWAHFYEFKNLKNRYLNLVKPKKILLGNENKITEEYLMTTSEVLYNKYKKL